MTGEVRTYLLTAADGSRYRSPTLGEYGGNSAQRVYGTMTCGSARATRRRFPAAFLAHRVFFADEAAALAAGYRPCGGCLPQKYLLWKAARRESTRSPDNAQPPAAP